MTTATHNPSNFFARHDIQRTRAALWVAQRAAALQWLLLVFKAHSCKG